MLLGRGVAVNKPDEVGQTPLHRAAGPGTTLSRSVRLFFTGLFDQVLASPGQSDSTGLPNQVLASPGRSDPSSQGCLTRHKPDQVGQTPQGCWTR